jgi:hypothetical protein
MARYRKIDPRIWNDEKFASLSHEGQRAFLFILTHPSMTSLGAFRATKEGIDAELGIDTKGLSKPFHELLSKGLIKYDESCFLVFAPNFLKYNQPENPNVVKGWAGCLDLLPECPLLAEVLQRAKLCASANSKTSKAFSESLGRVTETLSERYAKQLSKGLAIQEQEQEQEYKDVSDETSSSANANVRECESAEDNQADLFEKGVAAATVGRTPAPKNGQTESKPLSGLEHHPAPKVAPNPADAHPEIASETPQIGESDPADAPAPKSAKRNPPVPYQKVVDLYNAKCTPALAAARLTDKRKDDIRKRWHEMQEYTGAKTEEETLEAFGTLFDRVAHSDYLKGLVNGFKADFPWLMQREKFEFVLGGRYDNREHAAIDRNGHKGTSPLPDHLNPHLRFDEAYYTKENPFKPDGSLNWKD